MQPESRSSNTSSSFLASQEQMEQQSSSRSIQGDLDLGVLSAYEDALDESEAELKQLCDDAVKHLKRDRPRVQGILLSPKRSSSLKHKRSSSSDHSSIEKVSDVPESFRSRRPTASGRDGQRQGKGRRSGSDESGEEWRMMNYAFQEVANYPVIVQINQQLQLLSRQLYEIESTNSLQLKIISNLIGKLIKARHRPWFSFGKIIRFVPIALCIIFWPFVARAILMWLYRITGKGIRSPFFVTFDGHWDDLGQDSFSQNPLIYLIRAGRK